MPPDKPTLRHLPSFRAEDCLSRAVAGRAVCHQPVGVGRRWDSSLAQPVA